MRRSRAMFGKLGILFAFATVVYDVLATCPMGCRCFRGNEVECSSSGFIRVPVGLPDDTERLFLDDNNIAVVFVEDFRLMTNLKFLTLANSHLSEIQDDSFESLRQLEELNLNMNFLRIIRPRTLEGLRSLKILRIDQNQALRMSPCTLSVIPTIESINADMTRITFNETLFLNTCSNHNINDGLQVNGDEDFVSLDSLQHLRLERADASAINYRIMSLMPNIVSLNLQSTSIQSIEDRMFRRNRYLKTLFLTANLLRNVGNATFVGLKSLQFLALSSNHGLQIHPNTFLETRKLKTLYLDEIGLRELSINFFSFQQLTNLIISENHLTSISPGTLSGVGSIRICLGHNPWHCDCKLLWLYEWLRQFSLGNHLNCLDPICHSPANLAETPLLDLSRDAFQCISETVSEGPDRETETPFYARFVQWNSALTPPNDHGNYAWVPYTREPNHLMSSISTKRDQGWNQFGTSEDRETEMGHKPSQTVDVDSDVLMTMEPMDEENASDITTKPSDGVLPYYSVGYNDNNEESDTVDTFQKPNVRPVTNFREVANKDDSEEGITVIVLCTEVVVSCLLLFAILWIVFAIRRANKNRRDRIRGAENGLVIETISPLRYFQQR